ncbi:nucleotide-sugar transporter-domain-containing protein [Phlyctochytrium arcticum]|nr:nucleotide-sugar transporter-domain-containing protein [Phlyctochytrium arcticum]
MSGKTPTLFGFPLKWISLMILVVQNSALTIVMSYSRKKRGPNTLPYIVSTAVVMSELLKFAVCATIYIREMDKQGRFSLENLWSDLFGPSSHWKKMTVPAVLYFIQNNLQYLAVQYLDPATFQVTYQMKILTTALFSVWMLNRKLSSHKWTALVLLTAGIALVQLDGKKPAGNYGEPGRHLVGLFAVAVACVLSGLAGVWFEKVLKGTKASLYLRNMQLSIFSIIPGLFFGVYLMDGELISINGFFQGYTAWTWGAISCQALGGIIVALVVKYADNILKGFATSISIILSSVASIFLFDFTVTLMFAFGALVVLYATHLYGLVPPPFLLNSFY